VEDLRGEHGCPWDKAQTNVSLKASCVEEACEVVCGINILEQTGDAQNLKEELGDLLFSIMLQARIAEEAGLFSIDDVMRGVRTKMIYRHPHVFGEVMHSDTGEALTKWDDIKKREKLGKEWTEEYLPDAMLEAKELIDVAGRRKGYVK
jgi:tetrapyrrole methylase family protein/MazG family protein